MSTSDDARTEFFALLERAICVGSLISETVEDVDLDDPAVRAELKIILAEFTKAVAAIKSYPPQAA